jgi:uncharacterized protein
MIIYKSGGLIQDVDTAKRIVTGFYTSTGTVDSDDDIFVEGAFKKTLSENGPTAKNRIWHLWNHDTDKPISKPYLLEEQAKGVYFETRFPRHPIADMALALYQDGSITEHSVGFFTIKEESNQKGISLLKEVRMLEGSSVLWGANENTPTVGLKSEILQKNILNLEKLLKNGNFTSDEVFNLIEIEIEKIKTSIKSLEPVEPLQPKDEVKTFNLDKLTLLLTKQF